MRKGRINVNKKMFRKNQIAAIPQIVIQISWKVCRNVFVRAAKTFLAWLEIWKSVRSARRSPNWFLFVHFTAVDAKQFFISDKNNFRESHKIFSAGREK